MSAGSFLLSVSCISKILKSDFRRFLFVESFGHYSELKINLATRDILFLVVTDLLLFVNLEVCSDI